MASDLRGQDARSRATCGGGDTSASNAPEPLRQEQIRRESIRRRSVLMASDLRGEAGTSRETYGTSDWRGLMPQSPIS